MLATIAPKDIRTVLMILVAVAALCLWSERANESVGGFVKLAPKLMINEGAKLSKVNP